MEKAQKGAADAEKAGASEKAKSKEADPADDEDDEDDGDDDGDQAQDGKPSVSAADFRRKSPGWRKNANTGGRKPLVTQKPAQQDEQPKKSEKRDDAKPDPRISTIMTHIRKH